MAQAFNPLFRQRKAGIPILVACLLATTAVFAQKPTVASFTPVSGPVGTAVNINGSNFSSTPANNIVYFGTVKAAVTAASATQLTATVPVGANYFPISVTVNSLTTYSNLPFSVTGTDIREIDDQSFAPKVDFITGGSSYSVAIGDVDGDGKPDILTAVNNLIIVSHNITPTGVISASSFEYVGLGSVASFPRGLLLVDFDGDGKLDVATSGTGAVHSISVLRNMSTPGNVSFSSRVDFPNNSYSYGLAAGDIDGDGKMDIVVGASATISILKNTSVPGVIDAGSFAAKVDFTSGSSSNGIVVADLNNDGKPDIASANYSVGYLSVFQNNSTSGTINASSLSPEIQLPTAFANTSIAIGDLDGDLKPDLAVSNQTTGQVSVFRGKGSSTLDANSFEPRVDYSTTPNPHGIAIGDLNGDGRPELVVVDDPAGSITVLNNRSTPGVINAASFAPKVQISNGDGMFGVAIGDLDADNRPDLVTGSYSGTATAVLHNVIPVPTISSFAPHSGYVGSSVSIMGTNFGVNASDNIVYFGATRATVTSASSTQLIVTAPVGATFKTISVTVNRKTAYSDVPFTPTFRSSTVLDANSLAAHLDFTTDGSNYSSDIADIDGDGKPDVLAGTWNSGFSVFRNISSPGGLTAASLASRVDWTTGIYPKKMATGDLNGDGKLDVVLINGNSASFTVFINTSSTGSLTTGSFSSPITFPTYTIPLALAVLDIDGDGKQDVIILTNLDVIRIHRNTNIGPTFDASSLSDFRNYYAGENAMDLAVGDIDNDGKPDLVTASNDVNAVSIFKNTCNPGELTASSFGTIVEFIVGTSPVAVAIADFDVDGKPDLAVVNSGSSTVSVLRNVGSAGTISSSSFAGKVDFPAGLNPNEIAVGDFNGDGKPEFVVTHTGSVSVSMFRNTSSAGSIASGSFAAKIDFTMLNPYGLSIGDVDGDSRPDVVVGNNGSSYISVLRNKLVTPEPAVQPTALIFSNVTPTSMHVGFTAASGSPDGYIVVRRASVSPAGTPSDGTLYNTGDDLALGKVAYFGSATSFDDASLSAATNYYYSVYAFNGSGPAINYNYLATSPLTRSQNTLSPDPTAQTTGVTFSEIATNHAIFVVTAATGPVSGYLVIGKQGSTPNGTPPQDGTPYVAGDPLGDGFVAYADAALVFNVTSLAANINYFFKIYSYNGAGSNINYFTTAPYATTLLTLPDAPVASAATSVTVGSFRANWSTTGVTYKVELSQDDFSHVDASQTTSTNLADFAGLSAGIIYKYRVTAINGSGNSSYSNIIEVGIPFLTPPSPNLSQNSSSGFTLDWPAVPGATSYNVNLSTSPAFTPAASGYPVNVVTNSAVIAGLSSETIYYIQYQAVNALKSSAYCVAVSSKTFATKPVNPATGISCGNTSASSSTVTVQGPPQGGGYLVLRKVGSAPVTLPVDGVAYSGDATVVYSSAPGNFDDGPLASNTQYFYIVYPFNGSGVSINYLTTNPSSTSVITLPETPESNQSSDNLPTSFVANWKLVSGTLPITYDLEISKDHFITTENSFSLLAGPSYKVTGLTSGTTYYYRVRAVNAAGHSDYSMEREGSTAASGAPLNIVIVSAGSAVPAGFGQTTLSAKASGGSGLRSVTLKYRPITGAAFSETPAQDNGNDNFGVMVNETVFDEIGLEYYFEITDESSANAESAHAYLFTSYPASANEKIPFAAGIDGTQNHYQMFSIPLLVSEKNITTIFEELQGYDPARWRIFHYQNNDVRENDHGITTVEPGNGYWFTAKETPDIKIGAAEVVHATQDVGFTKDFEQGWNQIGDPYLFNLDWEQVKTANQSVSLNSLFYYNLGDYEKKSVLLPWKGAFVYADHSGTVTFPVGAKTLQDGRSAGQEFSISTDEDKWQLPIQLNLNGRKQTSAIGMHPEALESKDRYDEITVPRFIDYLELKTSHPEFFSSSFSFDMVPASDQHTWMFTATSNKEGAATITWNDRALASQAAQLVLVDLADKVLVDMKNVGSYSFDLREERSFKIIYSRNGEFDPGMTLLGSAYPNPFVTGVSIPVLVEKQAQVIQVQIFNTMGEQVRSLARPFGASGLQTIFWDGEDNAGNAVAPGLLLYRLGDDNRTTKKLIKQ